MEIIVTQALGAVGSLYFAVFGKSGDPVAAGTAVVVVVGLLVSAWLIEGLRKEDHGIDR